MNELTLSYLSISFLLKHCEGAKMNVSLLTSRQLSITSRNKQRSKYNKMVEVFLWAGTSGIEREKKWREKRETLSVITPEMISPPAEWGYWREIQCPLTSVNICTKMCATFEEPAQKWNKSIF